MKRFTSLSFLIVLLAFTFIFNGCENDTTNFSDVGSHDGRVIGSVHGVVKTADTNTPVMGVKITYVSNGSIQEIATDVNGYYRCDYLKEGSYVFTFKSADDGFATMQTTVNIAYDEAYQVPSEEDFYVTVVQDIPLYRLNAGISGTVYAAYDNNIREVAAGVEVKLTGFNNVLYTDYVDTTDENGNYSFTDIPAVPTITVMNMPWTGNSTVFGVTTQEVELVGGATVSADALIMEPGEEDIIVLTNNFLEGNVPVDGTLEMIFNRAIDEENLEVVLRREDTTIPVDFALDNNGFSLTVTPALILRSGTQYTLEITGRAIDYTPLELALEFDTQVGIELVENNLFIADGVPCEDFALQEAIEFTFNLPIDISNPNNDFILHRGGNDVLVDVSYEMENQKVLITPLGSYQQDTEYEISYVVYSFIPGDSHDTRGEPFTFRTEASGIPATITGLRISNTDFHADWTTTTIPLAWNVINDIDHYEVYGYNSYSVTDYVFIAEVTPTSIFGLQQADIVLPSEFDWLQADGIQTPFTNGIVTYLYVRAVGSAGEGEFSTPLIIRDSVVPSYYLSQSASANNLGSAEPVTITIRFGTDLEYLNDGQPSWGFVEAGGDPDYVLPHNASDWQYDVNFRNGTLTVTIPPDTDASGDILWMLNISDSSGNNNNVQFEHQLF